MADLTVTLRPEHARFADAEVAAGRGVDRESVVAQAMEALLHAGADAEELEYWKELRFRELIETAEASLERGEGIVVEDVGAWLEGLRVEALAGRADRAA